MFCPMCGAPNEDDALFCGNCGAALGPNDTPIEVGEGGTRVEMGEEAAGPATREAAATGAAAPWTPEVDREPPAEDELLPASPPPPRVARSAVVPTSGLAIASLVLGIGGLTVLPLIGSVLAIIFGYMARNDIRRRVGQVSGEGLALVGIVMGWAAVGVAILTLVLILLGFGASICGLGLCGLAGSSGY